MFLLLNFYLFPVGQIFSEGDSTNHHEKSLKYWTLFSRCRFFKVDTVYMLPFQYIYIWKMEQTENDNFG